LSDTLRLNLRVRQRALEDAEAASTCLNDVSPGRGDEFLDDLDHTFERLLMFPLSGRALEDRPLIRMAHLRRYPCTVFYVPTDDVLRVLRVMHNALSPEEWP
jgi:plasmid stabilization system protein ParE